MLQRVEGSPLPAIAQRGTGAYGVFNAKMLDAAEVTIALPDGRVLQATRQQITEEKAKGRKSWVGTFAEEPGSIVAFSTVRGVTAGFISYGAETWEILPAQQASMSCIASTTASCPPLNSRCRRRNR